MKNGMKTKSIYFIPALALCLCGCMKEQSFENGASVFKRPLNLDVIQSSIAQSSGADSYCGDTLTLTFCAPASSEATKSRLDREGKESRYVCDVSVDGHKQGFNAMTLASASGTKSIYGSHSTNVIPCNFLRIDENSDAQHTALYTFPSYSESLVLKGEVVESPESTSGKLLRAIELVPEQSYMFYANASKDSIFYHTRLIGWSPAVCALPTDGKPVKFSDVRYSNVYAVKGDAYGVVLDHAMDGGSDVMVSNFAQAQRWHPATGKNKYRDLAKQIVDDKYCVPFGYNMDEVPHYSNPMSFKHFLSAVRIWAKVAQDPSGTTLNLSTWGKILSLTFVDQPSTCTMMLPSEVGSTAYGSILENSWTDYTNFSAQCGLIYGEGDIEIPVTDQQVTYPIDMTQAQAQMEKKYLGYCLVMPGTDIEIAIQTSAGTYQATLPHRILQAGQSGLTDIFKGGMIYDVVLNLDTKGSVAEFIENEDTGSYTDLSPWDPSPDKQEFKTANCYIVDVDEAEATLQAYKALGLEDVPGYCFLGTVLGNGESGIMSKGITTFHTNTATINTPASAKVVWQSDKGLISNVHLQHGYIRFNVPEPKKGNAVIAALDADGKVVWSWHIWITDTPQVITSSKNYNYMDRNLGAISTSSDGVVPTTDAEAIGLYGLYYQWGRKDPFPGPLKYDQDGGQSMRITPVYNTFGEKVTSLGNYIFNQGETIVQSIEKPMHYFLNPSSPYYNHNWTSDKIDFLWGEEVIGTGGSSYYQKSIYDPCPYGYHVPAEEIQYLAETADTIITGNKYGLFLEDMFFPYAGYYGPDRNQTSNDGAAYYCGSKADYQSSEICSDEDGVKYSYFRNHRLRTYLSNETSWKERNIDGVAEFTYSAPKHYVTTTVVTTHHDYTNRCTASSVRCIKETNYELNMEARMTLSTRSVKKNTDTPVTFNLDGRTNKGVIKSANLVIYYKSASDGSTVTWLNQDLHGVSTAIFNSKTLGGYSTVTIPASVVSAAKEGEVFGRLDIVVSQGTQESSKSSEPYMMKDGFVLTVLQDASGTSSMIDAYCIDDTEEFSVLLPSKVTEIRSSPTTRLVKYGNLYPPVIGQPTTVTVYVNAPDATVTIDGAAAAIDKSKPYSTSSDTFYPYQVKKKTWDVKGWKNLAVTATKEGYGTASESVSVPVYGINVGTSKIDGSTLTRKKLTTNNGIVENWYVMMDKMGPLSASTSDYLYFNGLNIKWGTTVASYRYLMGFDTTSGNTKIYNAMTGLNCPFVEGGENKIVVAESVSSGQTFVPSAYDDGGWFSKTYWIHMKTTSGGYWDRRGGSGLTSYAEIKISDSESRSLGACRIWLYPVTFSVN